jgi:DNA-binding SARP family transcriptional activator/predicted ATPase
MDGELLNIRRRKNRAVIYYLAARITTAPRDHLLGLFWPDLDRGAAQQSLRTTLHELRKAVGDWLMVEGDQLGISPAAEVDVRLFERKLSPPVADLDDLHATLALYRGDFLDGFGVDAAPEFDDWLIAQAERYRRLAVRGLTALAAGLEAHQEFAAALEVLDRALHFDPLQEDIQRAALRLHYLAGDRAGAIRRYDRLRKLLNDEMAVPPMTETRQLYDAILNDTLEPVPPSLRAPGPPAAADPVPALPYTGRDQELNILQRAFVTTPRPLVLIEGEPGIGKTRLAQEFIAQTNAWALTGSARELEHRLPYQPITEALRSLLNAPQWAMLRDVVIAQTPRVWLNEVARLLPEIAPEADHSTPPNEARLWEGISQFLQTAAAHKPLIVFLDDIHWADTSTLALLGYLVRQTAHTPLTFISAARLDPAPAPLSTLQQTLIRAGQFIRISLARLSAPDIEQIAQYLSQHYTFPLAEWLGRVSEGNPYVLAELVQYARDHAILSPGGVVNLNLLSQSGAVPHTIYSMIQERLARVSDPARRMIDAAVAVGRIFEVEIVYHAAGLSETAALATLDELQNAGIITPASETAYQFNHHLIMEVAYREVGEVRHRILHRRVAEALENYAGRHHDDAAGLIAFHYAEGRAPGRATPYALRAGQRAMRIAAWAEAIRFFELALTPPALPDEQRFEALMALGDALYRAGQITQASETLRDALHLAEQSDTTLMICEARLRLASILFSQGHYAEAVALAAQYPVPHDPAGAVLAARAELVIGTALSLEGAQLDQAADHLQRGKTYLQSANLSPNITIDPIYAAHLDFELGSVAAQQGDLGRAISLYRLALTGAQQSHDPEALPRTILAHNNLAYHLHLLGDQAAIQFARDGLALAQKTGMLTLQPYLLSTSGEIALAAGDLDQAERYFEQGLALAEQTQNTERIAGLTANLGLVALEQSNLPLAIHRLSAAMAQADALGTRHLAAQIRLWLAPLLPRREALLRLAEARSIAEQGGRHRLLNDLARLEEHLAGAQS